MSSPVFPFSPFSPNYSLSSTSNETQAKQTSLCSSPSSLQSDLDPFCLDNYEAPSFLYSSYLQDLEFSRRGSDSSLASTNSNESTFSDCSGSTIVAPSSSLPTSSTAAPSLSSSLLEEYYQTPSNSLGLVGVGDWRSFGEGSAFSEGSKPVS